MNYEAEQPYLKLEIFCELKNILYDFELAGKFIIHNS